MVEGRTDGGKESKPGIRPKAVGYEWGRCYWRRGRRGRREERERERKKEEREREQTGGNTLSPNLPKSGPPLVRNYINPWNKTHFEWKLLLLPRLWEAGVCV